MAWPTRPCSYAHDLLHFLRWWAGAHKTSAITQQALTESTFLDYIRFQVGQDPPPAAASINRRVGTAERAMRREFPDARLCRHQASSTGTGASRG